MPRPEHLVGFAGTVHGGVHDGRQLRVVGRHRTRDYVIQIGAVEIDVDQTDEDDGPTILAIDDLGSLDAVIGGAIEWPSRTERAQITSDTAASWFADGGSALLEEPFAGPSLNAFATTLVHATVEAETVFLEFSATWDVRLTDILVLDSTPDSLTILSASSELVDRHPTTAQSVSQLQRIPFRWVRAPRS